MGHAARLMILVLAVVGLARTAAHAQVADDLMEGDRYFEEGNYKRAAQRYDSAIDKFPGQVSAEAYGKRAAIYILQKEYAQGLEFITRTAELRHPRAPEVLEQKALMLWLLDRRDQAIAIAERVASVRPEIYSIQGILGEYYAGRDPEKAVTAYEAYLANRPSSLEQGDVLPRLRLGLAYLTVGRYRNAQREFELLLKKHRKQPHVEINARNGLCAAYTALEQYDRAIATCDEIARNPDNIDPTGSVWYNLGRAYLGKRQSKRARQAGLEFIRLRRSVAKGYLLVGDSYFQERNWQSALQYYLQAEPHAGAGEETVQLGIKLGTTYRRLGRPGEAIPRLEAAIAVNQQDLALAAELGSAYLATRQDSKALATAERLLEAKSVAATASRQRAALLLISAHALYNQGKGSEARARYQAAYELRPRDVTVRMGLVQAIHLQAQAALEKNDASRAERFLLEALEVDRTSAMTNQSLAVLALERGACDKAIEHLGALASVRGQALVYHRLLGRAYLCRGDRDAAIEQYAQAEKRAQDPKLQANSMLAEIYTEWASLLTSSKEDGDLEQAVDKLRAAVQLAGQAADIADAAKRNLALAAYRRGWRNLRAGKHPAAVEDFQLALQDRQVLRGTEPAVFEFSLGLAYLERGDAARAARTFDSLASAGGQERYLAPAFLRLGPAFFAAYAKYRSDNSKLRAQAASQLGKLERKARGAQANKLRELTAASWAQVAFDAYRDGNPREAKKALRTAAGLRPTGKLERTIVHNTLVLTMGTRGVASSTIATLSELSATVPEAQANLGILYERQGKHREAYESWSKARQRGVRSRELQRWIDVKKRIFGF